MLLPLGSAITATVLASSLVGLFPLPTERPTPPITRGPAAVDSRGLTRDGVGDVERASRPQWVPPLGEPLEVLDTFRPPAAAWLPGHRGVDLSTDPGDEVYAAGAGAVLWAADLAGRGVISVMHEDGRRTTYEPVTAIVQMGDLVEVGDLLGYVSVGTSHCGGIPSCLHWGLLSGETYLDPMSLLRAAGRPRLLPVDTP